MERRELPRLGKKMNCSPGTGTVPPNQVPVCLIGPEIRDHLDSGVYDKVLEQSSPVLERVGSTCRSLRIDKAAELAGAMCRPGPAQRGRNSCRKTLQRAPSAPPPPHRGAEGLAPLFLAATVTPADLLSTREQLLREVEAREYHMAGRYVSAEISQRESLPLNLMRPGHSNTHNPQKIFQTVGTFSFSK